MAGHPNRRELFELGGAALAGTMFDRLWSEPGQLHEALDSATVSPARVAAIQQHALHLGVRVWQGPANLLTETLMRFRETRELLGKKQTVALQRELVRASAMYATVMGQILFDVGQLPLARVWYDTAIRAAGEAGDQNLADFALAGSSYLPTYQGNPRTVLDTVDPRLEADPAPSAAIGWLWGFKAKAHAMLGDRNAFQYAITQAHTALANTKAERIHPGAFSFLPGKLAFYEARGWVELSNADKASDAADRAQSTFDSAHEPTTPVLIQFERASAHVRGGELDEGCRVATAAVLNLDARDWKYSVETRAGEFDRLVGSTDTDATRDWREALASPRARHALPAAPFPAA